MSLQMGPSAAHYSVPGVALQPGAPAAPASTQSAATATDAASQPGGPTQPSPRSLALICVTEALDLVGSQHFLARARELERNSGCIVADLTQAEFLDSAGVRALQSVAGDMSTDGKELRLVIQPGSRVERTLNLLELLGQFQVYPTLAEACRHHPGLAQ